MKTWICALTLSVFALPQAALASPHLDTITCESINRWVGSDPRDTPLAPDERWFVRIESDHKTAEGYLFTFTKRKNGKQTGESFRTPAIIALYETKPGGTIDMSFTLRSPSNPKKEVGRMTSGEITVSSEPMIMYGWSTEPLTVTGAMEYRCQIQGVDPER